MNSRLIKKREYIDRLQYGRYMEMKDRQKVDRQIAKT